MSVLEIILYSCLGLAFIIWLIHEIVVYIKKKKGTYKKKGNEDDEN